MRLSASLRAVSVSGSYCCCNKHHKCSGFTTMRMYFLSGLEAPGPRSVSPGSSQGVGRAVLHWELLGSICLPAFSRRGSVLILCSLWPFLPWLPLVLFLTRGESAGEGGGGKREKHCLVRETRQLVAFCMQSRYVPLTRDRTQDLWVCGPTL